MKSPKFENEECVTPIPELRLNLDRSARVVLTEVFVQPGRIHHPTRPARVGTPVRSRF